MTETTTRKVKRVIEVDPDWSLVQFLCSAGSESKCQATAATHSAGKNFPGPAVLAHSTFSV